MSRARWRWRATALDAQEFAVARNAIRPLLKEPTQRVAMLMAEIEQRESGDEGRAREWMARALRAPRDPAMDRRRLCVGSLDAGVAGERAARRVPVEGAAGRTGRAARCDRRRRLGCARARRLSLRRRRLRPPNCRQAPADPSAAGLPIPRRLRPFRAWRCRHRRRAPSRSFRCCMCPTIRAPILRPIRSRNPSRPATGAACGCSNRRSSAPAGLLANPGPRL